MQSRKIVLLIVALAATPLVCKAGPFGVASGYNVVALGTVNSQGTTVLAGTINDSADITGRVAAAGEILNLTTVGSQLNNDPFGNAATFQGVSYAVVAGGGLNSGLSINVNSPGDVFSTPPVPANTTINFNGGGKLITGATGATNPIDFTTLRSTLDAQSGFLASSQEAATAASANETGTVLGFNATIPGDPSLHIDPSDFVLYASNNTLDVFTITAAQFASGSLDIHTNPGQDPTIIINVTGLTASDGGTLFYNENEDLDSELTSNVLFNFPTATQVTINDGELSASVLAPFAVLSGGSDLDGNIIAAQIGQTGEIHNIEFTGTLPTAPPTTTSQNLPPPSPVPEPGTLMMVGTGVASLAGALRRSRKSGVRS